VTLFNAIVFCAVVMVRKNWSRPSLIHLNGLYHVSIMLMTLYLRNIWPEALNQT
jgi:hypothetical protein